MKTRIQRILRSVVTVDTQDMEAGHSPQSENLNAQPGTKTASHAKNLVISQPFAEVRLKPLQQTRSDVMLLKTTLSCMSSPHLPLDLDTKRQA